jgi:hypothetical protein
MRSRYYISAVTLLGALALAASPDVSLAARSTDHSASPHGIVAGTVKACGHGAGSLPRMKVAAVSAPHRMVSAAYVQGGQYSLRLAPGSYVLKLEVVSGRVSSRRNVTVVAGRKRTVNFTVPSPCPSYGAVTNARGSARPPATKWHLPPIAVHLRWHAVTDTAADVVASGQFVAFDSNVDTAPATLINEQTGEQTTFPNCEAPLIGYPWLLLTCHSGQTAQSNLLVNLKTGQQQQLQISTGTPDEIGAWWIRLAIVEPPHCLEHCSTFYEFQNIYTGQQVSSAGAGKVADLNAQSLGRTLCQPLKLPTFGTLTVYGRLAVLQTPPPTGKEFLERCGSSQRLPIGTPAKLAANQRLMLWQVDGAAGSRFKGTVLRTLRRVRLNVPEAGAAFVALGTSTVYATTVSPEGPTAGYRLWKATIPSKLG